MIKSESIKDLAVALCAAQSVLVKAKKTSTNPYFTSKYADLESVWDAIRPALSANGLSIVQMLNTDQGGRPALITMILHSSGQYLGSSVVLPISKMGPQEMGSVTTYLKRYSLEAIVGLANTDDDAEVAEKTFRTSPNVVSSSVKNYAPAVVSDAVDSSDLSTYVATFGKYKGKTFLDIGAHDLESYVAFWTGKSKKDGEPLKGHVAEFISNAEAWLNKKAEVPAALNDVLGSWTEIN